jgi:hypothetical protein
MICVHMSVLICLHNSTANSSDSIISSSSVKSANKLEKTCKELSCLNCKHCPNILLNGLRTISSASVRLGRDPDEFRSEQLPNKHEACHRLSQGGRLHSLSWREFRSSLDFRSGIAVFPFIWDMTRRQWIVGCRRFETI